MITLRSAVFYIYMITLTFGMGIPCLPLLLLPRRIMMYVYRAWAWLLIQGLRVICGVSYKIEGAENIPAWSAIICSKHQSAWETLFFSFLFPNPVFVLKRELMRIPLVGLYIRKLFVPVDRGKPTEALKMISQKIQNIGGANAQVIIFPEGTRVAPGQRGKYNRGLLYIYSTLEAPITLVAHNSGVLWPRNSLKKLPGVITVKFLPAIAPNLDKREVMAAVENGIENVMSELPGCKPDISI